MDSSKFPVTSSSVNIYRSTAYSISSGNGWRPLELNVKNWDLNNEVTTATNASPSYTYSVFTPKVAGTYLVTVHIDVEPTGTGTIGLGIFKNGTNFTNAYAVSPGHQSLIISNTITLSLTDTITLATYTSTTADCPLAGFGPGMNYLSIQRLY